MDETYHHIKSQGRSSIGGIANWLQDADLLGRGGEMHNRISEAFSNVRTRSHVTLEEFKEAMSRLAAERLVNLDTIEAYISEYQSHPEQHRGRHSHGNHHDGQHHHHGGHHHHSGQHHHHDGQTFFEGQNPFVILPDGQHQHDGHHHHGVHHHHDAQHHHEAQHHHDGQNHQHEHHGHH